MANKNKQAGTFVRLDDETEGAVMGVVADKSVTKSAAIRLIIREWSEMKSQMISIPTVGIIKDGRVVFGEVE